MNQPQIDADNCHTANATDSAIKPEPSDVGAATSDAIADTATARPDAPAKRKRTYNKKTTLASQMDCFEEIIAVVPAAADGDDASANGRRGTAKRGTGATTSSPADGAADAAGAAGAPAGRPVTTKSFKCRLCDKVCKTKNSLHYHFLLHTGERPHQCDECGKGFFANSALKVHQRLHTGDKPYQCEVCSRAFRQWGDLRYHMSSLHSDEKNHQCEFCGKDFARRYSLVIHRRIHTGERNYKCEFCDKSFRASTYLQDHRRIHTGEKPFECEFCQKKFRVRGDLKRHWNIHTRKPKEEEMTLESLVLEATDNEGDEGLADAGDAGADQLEVVEIVEYGSDEFTIKAEPLEEGMCGCSSGHVTAAGLTGWLGFLCCCRGAPAGDFSCRRKSDDAAKDEERCSAAAKGRQRWPEQARECGQPESVKLVAVWFLFCSNSISVLNVGIVRFDATECFVQRARAMFEL